MRWQLTPEQQPCPVSMRVGAQSSHQTSAPFPHSSTPCRLNFSRAVHGGAGGTLQSWLQPRLNCLWEQSTHTLYSLSTLLSHR